ncbi:MAG: LPS export ABC transporter periplasmic protein LptC [Bacteroidetes bacterium]|uniref:LPS export ABC transporter periplasmic protein LptC n=1 Tax=Candidatus Merdivivens pullistercoris TaxID=2840873 RepID=A0A9D9I4S9_9BACT|nr:LPS export ABC transporter periplasmic protein LptC [Candidatus Merdivivens pullistercoris]
MDTRNITRIILSVAAVFSAATVVNSCKSELGEAKKINLDETPSQVVEGIFHIQSQNGLLQLRVEADRMERYVNDSVSYEIFPEGFNVFVYNEEGLLETEITSLNAMHSKSDEDGEKWEAYGDVVVKNIIKGERMETDTLYWDRDNERIYTDCYVRMYSPSGFMQGYGIISDQRARNSKILRPFDNFAIINNDSTKTYIDSVNFIGPIL